MRNTAILYNQYLDDTGTRHKIGGIENYINNLITIFAEAGYGVKVYQWALKPFRVEADGAEIVGVPGPKGKGIRGLVQAAEAEMDPEKDIVVFATDFQIARTNIRRAIAIQHGVAWDIPSGQPVGDGKNRLTIVKGALRALRKYERFKRCRDLVCVDYNFVNWYRTQVAYIGNRLHVIPNFAHVPPFRPREAEEGVSVIFARRFVEYRGTRLFAEAMENVLAQQGDMTVTFAGDGPDGAWLRNRFEGRPNICFIRYEARDSVEIHQRHDIAVVPTLGSEGTSLSLLEAMAAGCAVIATDVGGMTNIVLDGFNGLLIEPQREALEAAIQKLAGDAALRRRLAERGYETVRDAFSHERWKREWLRVIEAVAHGD